ncbi:MAG: hypothetical protein H0X41_01160 [Chitinophagaceae bacterium]|nr:hypothetical protein [Chitinophagaceae bacterium]
MDPALLIPIIVPLGFFALIFGIVYMQKKENLAMIDKGMNPKNMGSRGPEPFRYLKWGLLLVGAGVGLLIAYVADVNMGPDRNGKAHSPLYFALIAIGGGIGLIISYKMEMKELRGRAFSSLPSPSEP